MKIAIMQPYLFPYIGYFQLINSVDKFIIYDDVNFIKQGWINRNNILVNGKAFLFSVPIVNISSYSLIYQTEISYKIEWRNKLLKTIRQSYQRSPYFSDVFYLIEELFTHKNQLISELALKSIQLVTSYLDIKTEIKETTQNYKNAQFSPQKRVLDICKIEKATNYINVSGGIDLYLKEDFGKENIQLNFIKPNHIEYKQFNNDFIPCLSIIDVMMFNSKEEIQKMLINYQLL